MTTYGRFDLTDERWARIEPLLPPPKRKGRRPADRRKMLNGILWILSTGAGWRDLPGKTRDSPEWHCRRLSSSLGRSFPSGRAGVLRIFGLARRWMP